MSQLREVDWLEDPDEDGSRFFRLCEFCGESYMHDVWVNRDIRKFYLDADEIVVCENCKADYERGEP